jgi:tripartite-type tricarboxylate transporter receptor subunit TctC
MLVPVIRLASWAAATALVLACTNAPAQSYPAKPVRIVVGFAAGGNPDVLARMLAPYMADQLGQQVVVENRPGSNGNIAADLVAKAPPDGYTLFLSDTSTFSIGPHIYSKLPFDPLHDFTFIAQIAVPPMYVVVHPSLPIHSMQDLVAYAKANPGKLAYASAGNGSIHHLTTELFKAQTGVDMVHVPFKGSGQSAPALIAGDVQVGFVGWTSVSQAVRAGRLRVIGFASARRSLLNPEVPTIAETVAPGFDVTSPMGISGPAHLPRQIVERLEGVVLKAARTGELRDRMITIGLEPADGDSATFAASVQRDYDSFGRAARQIGLKLD